MTKPGDYQVSAQAIAFVTLIRHYNTKAKYATPCGNAIVTNIILAA